MTDSPIFPAKTVKVGDKFYAGVVFVPKGTTYRRTYEVAAWWTELATTEDRWYPVWARRHPLYKHRFILSAQVEATLTAEFTPSLFGGVVYGDQPQGKDHRNVGRQDMFSFTVMPDMVGEQYIPVTLGFVAVKCFYLHDAYGARDGVYNTESWEWRPYLESSLEHVPTL